MWGQPFPKNPRTIDILRGRRKLGETGTRRNGALIVSTMQKALSTTLDILRDVIIINM